MKQKQRELSLRLNVAIYSGLYRICAPIIRGLGGEFWLSCRRCDATLTPEKAAEHIRRHWEDEQ